MIASPTGVPSRPRSLRIGISVPSAVVVRAMTTATLFISNAVKYGMSVIASHAMPRLTAQVTRPALP